MLLASEQGLVRGADIGKCTALGTLAEIKVIGYDGFRQGKTVLLALAHQPFTLRVGVNQSLPLALHGLAGVGAQAKAKSLPGLQSIEREFLHEINAGLGLRQPIEDGNPRPIGHGAGLNQDARTTVAVGFRFLSPQQRARRARGFRRKERAAQPG